MVAGKIALSGIYEDILGPGKRLIIWVQGCNRSCNDCQSPHFARVFPLEDVKCKIDALFEKALHSNCTGITISGGEPFLQHDVIKYIQYLIKEHSERYCTQIDLLVYTGYIYEEILAKHTELLEKIDVLIDGPYIKELDDSYGLRGSSNQRILFLTDKRSQLIPIYENLFANRNQVIDFVDGRFVRVGLDK